MSNKGLGGEENPTSEYDRSRPSQRSNSGEREGEFQIANKSEHGNATGDRDRATKDEQSSFEFSRRRHAASVAVKTLVGIAAIASPVIAYLAYSDSHSSRDAADRSANAAEDSANAAAGEVVVAEQALADSNAQLSVAHDALKIAAAGARASQDQAKSAHLAAQNEGKVSLRIVLDGVGPSSGEIEIDNYSNATALASRAAAALITFPNGHLEQAAGKLRQYLASDHTQMEIPVSIPNPTHIPLRSVPGQSGDRYMIGVQIDFTDNSGLQRRKWGCQLGPGAPTACVLGKDH